LCDIWHSASFVTNVLPTRPTQRKSLRSSNVPASLAALEFTGVLAFDRIMTIITRYSHLQTNGERCDTHAGFNIAATLLSESPKSIAGNVRLTVLQTATLHHEADGSLARGCMLSIVDDNGTTHQALVAQLSRVQGTPYGSRCPRAKVHSLGEPLVAFGSHVQAWCRPQTSGGNVGRVFDLVFDWL
jgi:hypothetical protein